MQELRADRAGAEAIKAFAIYGDRTALEPYGSGHINDTFAVTFDQGGNNMRYILQRINHQIFRDVHRLMSNVQRVCAHAHRKLADADCPDASRRALNLVPTWEGNPFHQDASGHFWRVYLFIEGAVGYDVVQTPQQAYEAARAFGEFQRLMVDLPGERLYETIPDFHQTRKRFSALLQVLDADCQNRAQSCRAEIDWALAHQHLADTLLALLDQGLMPERITHNDTKLNNVLIDERSQEAICVIDLDTVMPGLALYDFGDLVRTSTSPAAEDEQDLTRVDFQLPMFEALAQGYLQSARSFLTPAEIESLPLAGMVMTYECGIRFLTDYLAGDTYFRTHRPGHNLDRCRTQFTLIDAMQSSYQSMQDIVQRHL